MTRRLRPGEAIIPICGALVFSLASTETLAQAAPDSGGFHGWQLEAHVGIMPSTTVERTNSMLPAPGSVFQTPGSSVSRLHVAATITTASARFAGSAREAFPAAVSHSCLTRRAAGTNGCRCGSGGSLEPNELSD